VAGFVKKLLIRKSDDQAISLDDVKEFFPLPNQAFFGSEIFKSKNEKNEKAISLVQQSSGSGALIHPHSSLNGGWRIFLGRNLKICLRQPGSRQVY